MPGRLRRITADCGVGARSAFRHLLGAGKRARLLFSALNVPPRGSWLSPRPEFKALDMKAPGWCSRPSLRYV